VSQPYLPKTEEPGGCRETLSLTRMALLILAPIVAVLVGGVLAVMALFTLIGGSDVLSRVLSGIYLLIVAAASIAYLVWERRRARDDTPQP
jgi:hypothetical protein